ncbi:hypothetical protein QAD02_003364 [Eretmocerus hayati]|uniref:Uncharacterized protein n=1 Tax=Eretmocerus hayati TaxID=131215 RepID=A0ACC2NRE1_9HYME|nr:hypothetical protein QAD02_003364 [Eretmocerus hayati]
MIQLFVWKNKAQLILRRPFYLGNDTSWAVYCFIYTEKIFNRNLLKRHSGKYRFHDWIITKNSGSGWTVENPPDGTPPLEDAELNGAQHCFASSRDSCSKNQVVELLEEGVTGYLLDVIQPPIRVSSEP